MLSLRRYGILFSAVIALLLSVLSPLVPSAFASTSVSYDFDSAGDLASGFNSYVPNNSSVAQSMSGGIGGTGAIAAASGNQYAVFASKASYSLGPVGSSYTFSSFIQSIGGNGYTGMGFTANAQPASGNTTTVQTTPPFRPSDALGISVHGGGFYFHNGANNLTGLWDGSSLDQGITAVTAPVSHDVIGNAALSADRWFKISLIITRDTSTTFDMQASVWPANADGTLIQSNPLVVMQLNDQTNSTLSTSPSINTYVNFSGNRVYYFDNYQVSLAGGSSVIAAGAPIVLTTQAIQASNVVTFQGAVTGTGGASVTERGFVYGTTPNPTISNGKVPVGSGIGSFQGLTSTLPNGTYYFRAYATNSTGTSYGVEEQLTLASVVPALSTPAPTPTPTSTISELAKTGPSPGSIVLWGFALISSGLVVLSVRIMKSKNR